MNFYLNRCSSNLPVKCWMGSQKFWDCLVNRPQTLPSPFVVYWSKSAFRNILMKNCDKKNLYKLDCFNKTESKHVLHSDLILFENIDALLRLLWRRPCWYRHLYWICSLELFSLLMKMICLLAAIFLKVTITSSVHNSIYWNEESCCD